jgi:hypothetical protein
MASDNATFPLSKVKAYRAYFIECRAAAKAAKGSPEFNDLDVTVKLCDQLVTLMSEQEPKPLKRATAIAT